MKKFIKNHSKILANGKEIGYLQLVYCHDFETPQLEYHLDEEFRGRRIMSKYLPKYLDYLDKEGITNFYAFVKEDNIASKKLLEKNGFIKFRKIRDIESYLFIKKIE